MRFLHTLVLSLTLLASTQAQNIFHADIIRLARATESLFPFGVASGDPEPNSVVLWSKVFPAVLTDTVKVQWVIATDTTLKNVVGGGELVAESTSAFTVQVNQQGLQPSTTYFYCFFTDTDSSAIGRTKTASVNNENLSFAVASCANYQMGYFNAYGHIAKRNDIDAVIFLGDYIYEYGTRTTALRPHIPNTEILSLEDYRSRYAQNRLDSNLLEAHRLHPFITIWDDMNLPIIPILMGLKIINLMRMTGKNVRPLVARLFLNGFPSGGSLIPPSFIEACAMATWPNCL